MAVRRVVTGHTKEGFSCIEADGPSNQISVFSSVPGFKAELLWATDSPPNLPMPAGSPKAITPSWLPGVGESRLMVVTFPPDSVMMSPTFDGQAAGMEYMEKLPGLAEKFEIDHPGMHTTETVDYGVLLSGQLWLELDNNSTTHLKRGDTYVLNGARHAWRNKSDQPAELFVVLMGAKR